MNPNARRTAKGRPSRAVLPALLALILLSACSLTRPQTAQAVVTLHVDGVDQEIRILQGSSVAQVISQAGVTLGTLDRIDPPVYTLVSDGLRITVVRIVEEYEVTQAVIAYAQQTITNESLTAGESRLIQPGVNGLNEITTRIVYENGLETARSPVKTVILNEALPEIMMVGVQQPFASASIPGRLVYLAAGNAWLMDGSSGLRTPVVTTGDMDGRIFSLSEDGEWLLFTRKAAGDGSGVINTLWAARVGTAASSPVDLQASNIVHFADFVPGSPQTVLYSTVEPRQAAPGWQANNDLASLHFSAAGLVTDRREFIGPNSGGIYGWWGTDFLWAGSDSLLYSRPDSIGRVDLELGILDPLVEVTPYQTNSAWALIPPAAVDASGRILYYIAHPETAGISSGEDSPAFDLAAVNTGLGSGVVLAKESGMFAFPALSPASEETGSMLAYLEAVFPDRSDTSPYRLVVSDQDGSNRRVLFPKAGSSGLDPQQVAWSPEPSASGSYLVGLVYQGNIWLADAGTGESQQLTGDGLTSRIIWN